MAIAIEQLTAPGKYYIDLAFEKIDRELANRPFVYINDLNNSYKKSSSENLKNNSLENRTKII